MARDNVVELTFRSVNRQRNDWSGRRDSLRPGNPWLLRAKLLNYRSAEMKRQIFSVGVHPSATRLESDHDLIPGARYRKVGPETLGAAYESDQEA